MMNDRISKFSRARRIAMMSGGKLQEKYNDKSLDDIGNIFNEKMRNIFNKVSQGETELSDEEYSYVYNGTKIIRALDGEIKYNNDGKFQDFAQKLSGLAAIESPIDHIAFHPLVGDHSFLHYIPKKISGKPVEKLAEYLNYLASILYAFEREDLEEASMAGIKCLIRNDPCIRDDIAAISNISSEEIVWEAIENFLKLSISNIEGEYDGSAAPINEDKVKAIFDEGDAESFISKLKAASALPITEAAIIDSIRKTDIYMDKSIMDAAIANPATKPGKVVDGTSDLAIGGKQVYYSPRTGFGFLEVKYDNSGTDMYIMTDEGGKLVGGKLVFIDRSTMGGDVNATGAKLSEVTMTAATAPPALANMSAVKDKLELKAGDDAADYISNMKNPAYITDIADKVVAGAKTDYGKNVGDLTETLKKTAKFAHENGFSKGNIKEIAGLAKNVLDSVSAKLGSDADVADAAKNVADVVKKYEEFLASDEIGKLLDDVSQKGGAYDPDVTAKKTDFDDALVRARTETGNFATKYADYETAEAEWALIKGAVESGLTSDVYTELKNKKVALHTKLIAKFNEYDAYISMDSTEDEIKKVAKDLCKKSLVGDLTAENGPEVYKKYNAYMSDPPGANDGDVRTAMTKHLNDLRADVVKWIIDTTSITKTPAGTLLTYLEQVCANELHPMRVGYKEKYEKAKKEYTDIKAYVESDKTGGKYTNEDALNAVREKADDAHGAIKADIDVAAKAALVAEKNYLMTNIHAMTDIADDIKSKLVAELNTFKEDDSADKRKIVIDGLDKIVTDSGVNPEIFTKLILLDQELNLAKACAERKAALALAKSILNMAISNYDGKFERLDAECGGHKANADAVALIPVTLDDVTNATKKNKVDQILSNTTDDGIKEAVKKAREYAKLKASNNTVALKNVHKKLSDISVLLYGDGGTKKPIDEATAYKAALKAVKEHEKNVVAAKDKALEIYNKIPATGGIASDIGSMSKAITGLKKAIDDAKKKADDAKKKADAAALEAKKKSDAAALEAKKKSEFSKKHGDKPTDTAVELTGLTQSEDNSSKIAFLRLDHGMDDVIIKLIEEHNKETDAAKKQKLEDALIEALKAALTPINKKSGPIQKAAMVDNTILAPETYEKINENLDKFTKKGAAEIRAITKRTAEKIKKANLDQGVVNMIYNYTNKIYALVKLSGMKLKGIMKGGAGEEDEMIARLMKSEKIQQTEENIIEMTGNAYYLDKTKFEKNMAMGYKSNCPTDKAYINGQDGDYKKPKNPVTLPFMYGTDHKIKELELAQGGGIDKLIKVLGGDWHGARAANIIVRAYLNVAKGTEEKKITSDIYVALKAEIENEIKKGIEIETITKYKGAGLIEGVKAKVLGEYLEETIDNDNYERLHNKGNMDNASVKKFVETEVMENKEIYDKIFIVRKISTKEEIGIKELKMEDVKASPADYQLIGKKTGTEQHGGYEIQRGGVGIVLYFFTIFKNAKYNGTPMIKIIQRIYINPESPGTVNGSPIPQPQRGPQPPRQPPRRPQGPGGPGGPGTNEEFYKWLMDPKRREPGVPKWVEEEEYLSTAILEAKRKEIWDYEKREYVPKKDSGFTAEEGITNMCGFVENDGTACMDAIKVCLESTMVNLGACERLVDLNYKELEDEAAIEMVSKTDPRLAFEILRIFHYGWYEEERRIGNTKVKVYKVESVKSWMEDFIKEQRNKRCFARGAEFFAMNCDTITSRLGEEMARKIKEMINSEDPAKHKFFKFMGYLVSWVNANPSVLNSEVVFDGKYIGNGMRVDDKYKLHKNVGVGTERRKEEIKCTIKKIRRKYEERTVPDIMEILQMVGGVRMKYNRNMVANPHGIYNMNMTGGLIGVYGEMRGGEGTITGEILRSLVRRANEVITSSGGGRITEKSKNMMNKLIDEIVEKEKKLGKLMQKMLLAAGIKRETRGTIDVSGMTEKEIRGVMEKHGLLQEEYMMNSEKAVRLLDIISAGLNGKYNRPIYR